ncbi:dihydrolipoyl dehydrogenase [Ramlibacter henchirensis]|uniref:Dihydrolipoyl dehydrogenase n=1 Tax=Ramlibacter henchirensis TaxID=204072 RepID=A0A4Z0C6U0_9BURK|nr:dihydrolipoyl dehydrogenase [Ramlibacter henchirensis]TFZ06098.1 dihydrolipoyl dehydrogenase [Ramlibacter henchirensis]
MKTLNKTLLVIGGGPGGYVAAIRAGQLGIPTVLVEGEALGGTCLNVGCIPSKALIHLAGEFERACRFTSSNPLGIRVQEPAVDLGQAQRWKDGVVGKLTGGVGALLRKAGVQVVKGRATIVDGKTVDVAPHEGEPLRIACEHLLLATGSVAVDLPNLPVGGPVITSTEALALTEKPQHLVVVGAGYIGLELGFAWRKLGVDVAVVEATGRILPGYDEELTQPVLASLRRLGITLHLNCKAEGLTDTGNGLRVRSSQADEYVLPADKVLVAVGRVPRTAGFGLESLQLDMAGRAVRTDEQCRTSMRNVWAIGDLTGEPMLAHRAMAQGEMVAEIVAGRRRRFAPMAVPAVCFTDPELVVAGLSPDEAEARGMDVQVASFPFAANGRALSVEGSEGFVRVVARKDTHQVLGWQAVGQGVSELSTAFCYAIEMGARLEDVAGIIHAHPTLGEAVQESALRALGHALHI